MVDVREIRDISYVIDCPVVMGVKDIDGDICTLLVDTLKAKASDDKRTDYSDSSHTNTPQEKESTYLQRWMYFYLSANASPFMLKGWGDFGQSTGAISGSGRGIIHGLNSDGAPTMELIRNWG